MRATGWIRPGGAAIGAGLLVWGAIGASWRGPDGEISARVCVLVAVSAAIWILAAVARTTYRTTGAWLALALVGQAVSLQLIDAGPALHYQHYLPLTAMWAAHPWFVIVLALQAIAVSAAWGRVASKSRTWRQGPWARVVLAFALSACTAATVSPDVRRYVAELAFAAALQLLAIATVVLAAIAIPVSDRRARGLASWLDGADAKVGAPIFDRTAWIAAAVTAILAASLSVVSYERHPHVPDEVAYLYHARYFADGMLSMPAPPVAAAFDVDLMNYEPTRWFSPVPPAWPAVLAIGVVAGAPWLINPLLAGLNVLLASALLGHLYGRGVARRATILLACSPWFIFLGMSYMTHMVTLTCAIVAALGVIYARRSNSVGWAVLAGAAVGATSLLRPLDGVVVGALIAAWALGAGGRRLGLPALAGLACGTAAVGALVFPYNRMMTGSAFVFPINAYVDKYHAPNANAYGFGPDRGMGWPIDPNPGHGPVDAMINADLNTFGLNTDLFGWSTGSLIFLAWLLCAGRFGRSDRLMIATIAVVFAAYFFYYFSGGPDFGARYWFPIVVPLVALTARGVQTMAERVGVRVDVVATALVMMALVNFVPWRALDKYRDFRGMRPDLRALAADVPFGRDLVLVSGRRFPDYASAIVQNPIDLKSDAPIYAWNRDPEVRDETLRAYEDRRVWLVDGPSITGHGYRIAAGPLSASSLLAGGAAR